MLTRLVNSNPLKTVQGQCMTCSPSAMIILPFYIPYIKDVTPIKRDRLYYLLFLPVFTSCIFYWYFRLWPDYRRDFGRNQDSTPEQFYLPSHLGLPRCLTPYLKTPESERTLEPNPVGRDLNFPYFSIVPSVGNKLWTPIITTLLKAGARGHLILEDQYSKRSGMAQHQHFKWCGRLY